jgi:hypothetical protein
MSIATAVPPHRIGLIPSIKDERYRELGERVVADHPLAGQKSNGRNGIEEPIAYFIKGKRYKCKGTDFP